MDLKFFLIGRVYSCVQAAREGKSYRWNKVACRSTGQKVSKTLSNTELTCSTAGGKFIHYGNWDKHRTMKNNKTTHLWIELLLTLKTDKGKTFFSLLKASKIKSSSNFSQLQLSTAILLKQKRLPGYYIADTSKDIKAMKNN